MIQITRVLLLVAVLTISALFFAANAINAVPVDLYAGDFVDISGKPLSGYTVLYEETNTNYTLDSKGYLHLDIPVGNNVTFVVFGGDKYLETQTATVTVPAQGLTGKFSEIVLQVPDLPTFELLNLVIPHKRNFSQCQVVVTVCSYMKSWYNCPQGWPGVAVSMLPANQESIFYFGTWGKLSNKTNPLPNKLTGTSWDGGVFLQNIDFAPGQEFIISAHFGSVPFSQTRVKCLRAGKRLINGAPNQGPRAQAPISSLPDPDNC